jgi:O-antigen/teichoic acid export membrane protein
VCQEDTVDENAYACSLTMSLKKNILANYIGGGMVALAPILALPWYLAALGPKQFGLVSFVVMLQALFGLLDAGMSQALVREIAVRLDATDTGRRSTAALLFGFERIYWMFALGAGCVMSLLADIIAVHWLNLGDMPVALGTHAVYGAAVIFAVQFPGSIYRSLLVGAQAQTALNGVMFVGALLRHLGGVIIVIIWPTLTAYLIWHASIALLETLVRAGLAWGTLNVKRSQVGWKIEALRPAWSLAAGMSGAVWLGALTVQMDKIVLSRMAPIEQFGYYVIAATAAAGLLQLIYPVVQAVLPHAVQLRADAGALRSLSLKTIKFIALLVGLTVFGFMAFGKPLLEIWLRNTQVAETVYPLLAILLVGTGLNAFYNVGYVNWIVHKRIHRILQVNALAFVLSIVLIPLFVAWKGIAGAAFGWLSINLIGFMISLEWLKRK